MAQATLPPWIQALHKRDPEFVDSYMAQRERILREMSAIYPGNLIFGEDRMEVPVTGPVAAKLL